MKKLNLFLIFAFAVAASYGDGKKAMTQEEVDRIVDTELLMYEHAEDFQLAEKALIDRGVTKSMLAHGYYASLVKTMNAETGSLESQKFQSAIYGYIESADDSQITNLLAIASAATNEKIVSKVIRSYYRRSPLSGPLIRWCSDKLASTNCQERIRYDILSCFESSMKMPAVPPSIRDDILSCAHKSVLTDPMSVLVADRILCDYEKGYEASDLRKMVVGRIMSLKNREVPDVVKRRFDALLKKESLK